MEVRRKQVAVVALGVVLIILAVGLGMRQYFSALGQAAEKDVLGSQTASPQQSSRSGPNRLAGEKSPYLLQHAYNPVNWFPWGEEAFEESRKHDKPIFLSVGYSTCHWCHVMERESFSNAEIAAIMNEHFVCIKVDREERPDIDAVYMAFVQATIGRGGWPMSVFLTPDLQPFYGGTYFPPQGRDGLPGFPTLLSRVAEEWDKNRQAIVDSAGEVTKRMREFAAASPSGDLKLEEGLLARGVEWYRTRFDSQEGGFGGAPKFPRPVNLGFLLRYHDPGDPQKETLPMVTRTLERMARGGIHDHLGGGFHRYSTDRRWFLPHFEKMLYDQAQLAISYLEAYQVTGDMAFGRVARGIFDYVLRDMRGPAGGFYSAEDADSSVSHEDPGEHAEGAFYVWAGQEVREVLGEAAAVFTHRYGIRENGNVEEDRFDEFTRKNILHVSASLAETAEKVGKSQQQVETVLRQSRKRLLEVRNRRPRPGLDDKVLTAWNGLMISALAKGYQILRDEEYLTAAERGASFIGEKLYNPRSNRLKRRYREGEAAVEGLLDDYAFFIQGLLDLYESSLDGRWLLLAIALQKAQNELFWDDRSGGFYSTDGSDSSILIRMKEDYDGAIPSPNSISVLNLIRLAEMTGRKEWREMARQSIQAFSETLSATPQAMPHMMVAVSLFLHKPRQILIAGHKDASDTRAILREVHRRFLPGKILLLADGGPAHKQLAERIEVLDSLRRIDGRATAYICENYVCKLPTNQIAVVAKLLDEK